MAHPDYAYYRSAGCREVSLGIQKMPEPYVLFESADQSHFFWFHKETGTTGPSHWNMWFIYRSAKARALAEKGGK